MKKQNEERRERIGQALEEANWDVLVCALPANVLLLSGYWPVVGSGFAIATREGQILILAPEDERELAEQSWADEVCTFQPASLDTLQPLNAAVRGSLESALKAVGGERIGYEEGPVCEPASYAAMALYAAGLPSLLRQAKPNAFVGPADDTFNHLRAVKTPYEIERIRIACRIAEHAFQEGARQLRIGMKETEAAQVFRAPLSTVGVGWEGVERADGFTFCMSGANGAQAYAAYQRSRATRLAPNTLALLHCNSYADGFWTDITRTYCLGEPDDRQRALYEAIFAARQAALSAIRPGVKACEVDKAAREVMEARGYGHAFKHPTGHGVGFRAIDHMALPCLHPLSNERLETGMVFNVEPGLYFDGDFGLRHCDMAVVTTTGAALLTPFQADIGELLLTASV